MKYWVYENWTARDRAVIHVAPCPFCNNGTGIPGKNIHGKKNGVWHGPFTDVSLAESAAVGTKRDAYKCSNCKP